MFTKTDKNKIRFLSKNICTHKHIYKYKYKHKIKKEMKVSKLIIEKILTDSTFSGELAISLGIKQQSVIGLAKRNSEKLTLYQAVLFYREKGFTEKEIFEDIPKTTNNNK